MPYTHLTYNDRYVIHHLVIFGLSYREIGRRLNRHHTTISREIKRNGKKGVKEKKGVKRKKKGSSII